MKRHKHGLSHYHLTTCDMGQLVPVGLVEVLPGDSFLHSTSALVRCLPLVTPVMHPVQVRIHHWYVPNRILWTGWEDFITGVNDSVLPPTVTNQDALGSLGDYMGLPQVSGIEVSALPFRAYNKIYNEFYRDQDLIPEVAQDVRTVQNVSWGKDYFTTARPWTQKGAAVTLPLGTLAPIIGLGVADNSGVTHGPAGVIETGGPDSYAQYFKAQGTGPNSALYTEASGGIPQIFADLAETEGVAINDVRRAFALQRYQEARARYGSRYSEYLRYLGVRSSDARLQRPEYLGGGKQTIAFSEVLQTSEPFDGTETLESSVGRMAGHGIASVRTRRYRRFFEEHGWVLTLLSVRPRAVYGDGVHRSWSRRTKEDYWQKELEAIGQQEVYNKELYVVGDATDEEVFGYTDRYREYREVPSYVSGEMRVGGVLDSFHYGRSFTDTPVLNQSFVECEPTKRPHAVETNHVLWLMISHRIMARRMVNRTAHARVL